MENIEKLKNSKEIVAYLVEKFPACFVADGEAKPLKIGIFQDLAERLGDDPRVSKTMLRAALRQYTSNWRYLHALKAGQARVDLDGNLGELITEEHIEHAKKALKESKERVFANRRDNKEKSNAADGEKREPVAKPKKPQRAPANKKVAMVTSMVKPTIDKREVAMPLVQLDQASLKVGQEVRVMMGKTPLAATIKEITRDDVQLQLQTGMMLRVTPEFLVQ